MKINSRIPQTAYVPQPHLGLRRLLGVAAADPPTPTIVDLSEARLSKDLETFFEEKYVRDLPEGADPNALTPDEDTVLSYMTGEYFESVFVLCGHAGTGKTTLLLYLTTYLPVKRPDLGARFLPIYVGLSDVAAAVADLATFTELSQYLRHEIVRRFVPTLMKALMNQPVQALRWINAHSASTLAGTFGPADEAAAQRDPQQWLSLLSPELRDPLYWDLLLFVSSSIRPVVVVFDNVDRFSRDVHARILSFGDELRNYRIGCVAAMRHSTYKELDLLISEKRDPSLHLEIREEMVVRVLQKRLEWAQQRLPTAGLSAEDIEVSRWLGGLLQHAHCTEALAGLTGQNLHRMGKNFDRMAKSHHFQLTLLQRARKQTLGEQVALVYSALFGNYNGAFKANEDAVKAGVVNVFCGMQGVTRPFAVFTRLNILSLLHREERVNAGVLVQEYCGLFRSELAAYRVALRSLLQLIRSGLVVTILCRKIADTGDVQRVLEDRSDGLQIAPSGRHYLLSLIFQPHYLYFMKDDTELRDDSDIGYSVVGERHDAIADGVCRFVRELAELERSMWYQLAGSSGATSENALKIYRDRYSARGLVSGVATASFAFSIWERVHFDVQRNAPYVFKSTVVRDLQNSLGDLVRAEVELALS